MRTLRIFALLICVSIFNTATAQKEIALSSPDSAILYFFKLSDSTPNYRVVYKKKSLIKYSSLNLAFMEGGDFGVNTRTLKPVYKPIKVDTGIDLKTHRAQKDHYNEVLISIVERGTFQRKVNLRVRAYNEGIAFRFEYPSDQAWSNLDLTEEIVHFRFAGTPQLSTTNTPVSFDMSAGVDQLQSISIPDRNAFVILKESKHQTQSHLVVKSVSSSSLIGTLPELPGQGGVKMRHNLPFNGPWRIIAIGSNAQSLPSSNLLVELQ